MIGKKINGYELLRKIGEGGMAEVYYAENRLRKSASVKVLKNSLCEVEGILLRFQSEAEVMVALNHPNIRQVYDYAEIDGRPAIIMEYLDGESLKDYVQRRGSLDAATSARYWNDLVSALNYTHKQGVVHRDIKPSNIFITKDGNVKLLDFGIAKIKDSLTGTQTGQRMGTLIYMSPEQVTDSKHVDFRTDVYSLAVTFVQVLSGLTPYDAETSSEFSIMKSIVEDPLDMSGVPTDWQTFLRPYLAKEREQRSTLVRFSEPAKTSAATEETVYSSHQSASAPRQTPGSRQPSERKSNPKVEPEPKPGTRSTKRRNWLIAGGVAFAVAVLSIVIVLAVVKKKQKVVPEEEIIENAVTDYDGNSYDAVQIGDQVWMAENLRTTHYSDGTSIPQGSSKSGTTGYWYYPDGKSSNKNTYGLLYDWPAVMHGSSSSERNPSGVQGICPKGWHVPSDSEWNQLTTYVKSQSEYVCSDCSGADDDDWRIHCIAKALASTTGWRRVGDWGRFWDWDRDPCTAGNNRNTNNATGFSAVPAGIYNGNFNIFGIGAYFWSSTRYDSYNAYYRYLYHDDAHVRSDSYSKNYGFSVRCVRD